MRSIFKIVLSTFLFVALSHFTEAQTSSGTQTFSGSGTNSNPVNITFNIPDDITINEGKEIISVTISSLNSDFEFMGLPLGNLAGCGDLFSYNLNLDGVNTVMAGCPDDINGQNLTNVQVVKLLSVDMGAIPIPGIGDYDLDTELKITVTWKECDANAGIGSTITPCMNEPIDLESYLTGNPQGGGVWTGPDGSTLSNGQITTPDFIGQYNYTYSVEDGEDCSDEAVIVVDVQDCDYLSVNQDILDKVVLSPNPTKDLINISGLPTQEVFNIEIVDVFGKKIYQLEKVQQNATFDMSNKTKGIYFIILKGNNLEKTFKFIKI